MAAKRYTEKQVRDLLSKTSAKAHEIEALFENVSETVTVGSAMGSLELRYNGKEKVFEKFDTWAGEWYSWNTLTRDEVNAACLLTNDYGLTAAQIRKIDALSDAFDA